VEEIFYNDYVIKIEAGHPGFISYTIIANKKNMSRLVAELGAALKMMPDTKLSDKETGEQPQVIWSAYATKARQETSRVYLKYALANDLSPYHVIPKRKRDLWATAKFVLLIVLIVLAWIGVRALGSGFRI